MGTPSTTSTGRKTGRWVALAGVENKIIHNLLSDLDRGRLIPVATQPPPAHAPVKAFLAETIAMHARDRWKAWFRGRDVYFAPIHGNLHIGNPIKFPNEPPRLDMRVRRVGEHNPELLG